MMMHGTANVKSLTTFRDNLSVPTCRVKDLNWILDHKPRNIPKESGSHGNDFSLIADNVDINN